MTSLPSRRWNPGFIALRWRHLFWSLPLLGLLAGLYLHFLPMIRNTATGIVHMLPGTVPLGANDVLRAIDTDEVLTLTGTRTDLSGRWNLKGEQASLCTDELRRSLSAKSIPGTALVEISVSARSREESELIWDALVTVLKEHFEGLLSIHDQSRLDELEAAVERQKADVETKRRAIPSKWGYHDLLHRKNPTAPHLLPNVPDFRPYQATPKEVPDYENSQKLLELLQIKLLSEKIQAKTATYDALIIHRAPGTPVPVSLWDTLRPLVLHSSFGLGSGMVVAVVLAYLLELLFPRKSPTL